MMPMGPTVHIPGIILRIIMATISTMVDMVAANRLTHRWRKMADQTLTQAQRRTYTM